MARLARLTVPGYPHHVIQRGNNRQAIFVSPDDHRFMLGLLAENALRFGVQLHAYVLMGNHFHLLATPGSDTGLSQMMQAVGRRYVRYFNDRQGRTGTLWEGRYRSTLVQTERYLLACMAYIDLNPVRAGMVAEARDHPWSSHHHYIGTQADKLVTPHPLYWSLGNTPFAREVAYADLVRAGVAADTQAELTASALSGWPLGEASYVADLQKHTQRRVHKGSAGRPLAAAVDRVSAAN